MEEENKQHEHRSVHKSKNVKKTDIWKIVSGILFLLLIASFFFGGSDVKGTITKEEASEKAIEFINENMLQPGTTATVKEVVEEKGLYKMVLQIGTNEFDSYVTKDGGVLFPSVVDLNAEVESPQTQQNTEVEKADKATAELYIFSYCPAGSAALDSFAEASKVLKDVADVKVKFFSEMHGEYEKQQNIIQDCIQKVDSEKYWDYAVDFLEKVYKVCAPTRDAECDKEESIKLMKEKGIDSDAVMECLEGEGPDIYASDKQDAGALQLRYSPSVVVNGVYVQNADRSPEGLKTLICNAFNEPPEVCSEELEASAAKSSGSC
jgi:protein-disulfide isomerase